MKFLHCFTNVLSFWLFFMPHAYAIEKPITFVLTNDPIDVVIPAIEKDLYTLELCIKHIKSYGKNIRNIYVISPRKLTENAYWINEKSYPFSILDVAKNLFETEEELTSYLKNGTQRIGWYLQQLLKLYAPIVIPNISPNVLVLDADTLFIKPISFMNELNEPLFCDGGKAYCKRFFELPQKLLPGLTIKFPTRHAIAHHMLFQKDIILHLLNTIEKIHRMPAWQAICRCVQSLGTNQLELNGLSEFELYLNYVFAVSAQGHIRSLKWQDLPTYDQLFYYQTRGYDFISCHSYIRDKAGYDKGVASLQHHFKD